MTRSSTAETPRDTGDRRAVRLLEGALQHLPAAFALVEAPSGRVLLRNEQTTRIFRIDTTPETGIAGYGAFVGFHPDGRQYEPEEWPLARSILQGEMVSGEVAEIVRGDGTRGFIRMTSAPVQDETGAIVAGVVTFEDVTEWLEREQASRTETEAALKTRDEFLAAASHELRNPLNALQLHLEGLRRIARKAPASLSWPALLLRLDKADEQIARLVRLVDTLLDVSRIKEGRLVLECGEVDLVAIANDVLQLIEPVADGIPIHLDAPERLSGLWDALRLEQVLLNLLSNALKYGDGHPVRLSIQAQPTAARIEIEDEGVGMSPDMVSRIFARFERLTPDRRRGGFGLGLWTTRQIVHAMGGGIDIRSEIGKGSTFIVEVPYRPAATGLEQSAHVAS
jgi:signal transduction histidine kinase